jgi:CRISPR system Cascade subunit CasA
MTHFSFNLVSEPWLPVVGIDGQVQELGLREVLARAHEFRELAGENPLVTGGLHRLLLAVLHRIFGPKDRSAWRRLWEAGRWDAPALDEYLFTWLPRFDLFNTEKPFYQAPDPRVSPKSAISLMPERASGNNPILFDHSSEEEGVTLVPAAAARALVTAQAFALAGPCIPQLKLYFTDGAWARGVTFLVEGQNLFQTLLLNMIRYPSSQHIPTGSGDRPAWEMEDPFEPERQFPLGYLDYLTWQNRRIVLHPQQADGHTVVRQMSWAPGLSLDPNLLDPMHHYRLDEKRGPLVLRFREDRALWRDSAALLELRQAESRAIRPPETLHWLRELVEVGHLSRRHTYRLQALGMANNQAKVEFFRLEKLPLPLAYLEEEALANRLRDALSQAEEVARRLRSAVQLLAQLLVEPASGDRQWGALSQDTKKRGREWLEHISLERNYWSDLELPFFALVRDLPETPGAAEAAWSAVLRRVAWKALDNAIGQAGDSAHALKAAVRARARLGYGLKETLPESKEPVP